MNGWRRGAVLAALALAAIGWSVSHLLLIRWGRDTRALHRTIERSTLPASPPLIEAAGPLGMLDRVVEIDDPRTTAFTYGAGRPRIAVSRLLIEELAPEQLEAVLRHEEAHLRRLDPLRRSLLAVASATFWYVPLVRYWQSVQVMRQELRADRHALDACGCRAVAGALLAVSREAGPDPVTAAMANPALLGARIAHLEGQTVPSPPLTWSLMLRSSLGMAAVAMVAVSAIYVLGCP
ncbi:M56 family metallopeptidase [Streptomyces sp. So13.3]|uniref:M56 family metallopeptidase n=1 Tax=Streptomyces TaxID=1883 RepID=UPI00164D9BC7|nr:MULTISPECIES: M56 family metallopeptidase [unclassified Streptomyces]MCZ4101608.1 M56 family metallopeptidase [Streptomyces sp. H39-C1]QNA76359.1 M56 family metallopeptidase [Streptomyces sp. So13.3]